MFWRNRKIQKICVIRLKSRGDLFQASAPLKALREKYPDTEITFVVGDSYQEIIEYSPIIDKLIVFGRSKTEHLNIDTLPAMIWRLLLNRYDLLIDLQGTTRTRMMSFFSLPYRRTSIFGNYSKMPNLERYRFFLNRLGITGDLPPMETWLGDESLDFASNFLNRAGIKPDDFLIGLNPAASWLSKEWPPDFYAQVGNYFTLAYGAKSIVFGAPHDRDKALKVYQLMDKKPILAAGRTSFSQSGAMISRCNLFITGETALMQLARGLKIPSIVLFGSTDPNITTAPLPDFMRVIRDDECSPCCKPLCSLKTRACLWAIRPDAVIAEAEEVLGVKETADIEPVTS